MSIHGPFQFSRTTDRGVHGDLLMRLGAWRHTCDSYYLAIDESPAMGVDLASALARLLEQWVEQLEQLRVTGTPAFLPFDFSDQCTGWLRVSSTSPDQVLVEAGWSGVAGWSFYPSDIADTAAGLSDFEPVTSACVECGLDDLIAAIRQSQVEIMGS
jgi:hypothetical protein